MRILNSTTKWLGAAATVTFLSSFLNLLNVDIFSKENRKGTGHMYDKAARQRATVYLRVKLHNCLDCYLVDTLTRIIAL